MRLFSNPRLTSWLIFGIYQVLLQCLVFNGLFEKKLPFPLFKRFLSLSTEGTNASSCVFVLFFPILSLFTIGLQFEPLIQDQSCVFTYLISALLNLELKTNCRWYIKVSFPETYPLQILIHISFLFLADSIPAKYSICSRQCNDGAHRKQLRGRHEERQVTWHMTTQISGRHWLAAVLVPRMEGEGEYTFPTGTKYVGETYNGMFHGHGVLHFPNGSKYEAKWQNGIALQVCVML